MKKLLSSRFKSIITNDAKKAFSSSEQEDHIEQNETEQQTSQDIIDTQKKINPTASNIPPTNLGSSESFLGELINQIKINPPKIETASNQALLKQSDGKLLIEACAKKFKISNADSVATIAIICQKGGTSKRAQGEIYATVNGKRITLLQIREVITQNNWKFTLRQWARTYANEIYMISEIYSIQGDLAKILSRSDDSLSEVDLIWCSNFQMDNNNAPTNVRENIKKHFDGLFNKQN
jgi:hypothetical protein